MTWHEVADATKFEPGSRIIADIRGTEIGVFNIDNEFHALANFCVHAGGPLCEGPVEKSTTVAEDGWNWEYGDRTAVYCPWHHWKFDIESGESLDSEHHAVPSYETKIEDGIVYVKR